MTRGGWWWLFLAGAATAAGAACWRAFRVEPRRLAVSWHRVPVQSWPEGLGDVRIAHLTDLHLRGWGAAEQAAAAAIGRAAPDLVVFTGDYLERWSALPLLSAALARLRGGCRAFAVLGDNDGRHLIDTERLVEQLQAAGVDVLRNEARLVPVGGGEICLIGVDDPHSGQAQLGEALRGAVGGAGKRRPTVLLAHSPEIVLDEGARSADLILAGHTHGGQVCLPLWGPIITNSRLGRRFARGLRRWGGARVYTNRGLGMARIPARFCCPPELAFFQLVGAEGSAARAPAGREPLRSRRLSRTSR